MTEEEFRDDYYSDDVDALSRIADEAGVNSAYDRELYLNGSLDEIVCVDIRSATNRYVWETIRDALNNIDSDANAYERIGELEYRSLYEYDLDEMYEDLIRELHNAEYFDEDKLEEELEELLDEEEEEEETVSMDDIMSFMTAQ